MPELVFSPLPNWANWLGALLSIVAALVGIYNFIWNKLLWDYRIERNQKKARKELNKLLDEIKASYLVAYMPSMLMIRAFHSASDGIFALPFSFTVLFVGIWLYGFESLQKVSLFLMVLGLSYFFYLGWYSLTYTRKELNGFVSNLERFSSLDKRVQFLLMKCGYPEERALKTGRKMLARIRRNTVSQLVKELRLQAEPPIL